MLLNLNLEKSSLNFWVAAGFHGIAVIAPWLSALSLPVKLVVSTLVCWSAYASLRTVSASNEITAVHFQEKGCQICLMHSTWLAVRASVVRCDRFLVIIKLHSKDKLSSPHHRSWQLWFYPGSLKPSKQRQLRRFIRLELM